MIDQSTTNPAASVTAAPAAPTSTAPNALTPEQQRQQQMQAFMRAPVPKIYANGIGINGSAVDISIVFLQHSVPSAVASMSYVTAKTLLDELGSAIANMEKVSGEKIKSIADLAALSSKHQKK